MKRRSFLASTAVAGAALVSQPKSASAKIEKNQTGKEGVLNLSFQEGICPTKIDGRKDHLGALNEKLDWMEEHGIVGFEPGGGGLERRVEEIQKALNGRKIKVSAICAGFGGAPCATDPKDRQIAKDTMTVILQAAGELGSTGLIFVPAFNQQSRMSYVGLRYELIEFLNDMGPVAEKANCPLLLEPLTRWETWYVRQLADGAKICDEVNHPFVKMMGDFYHMGNEEPCDYAAFMAARKHLRHVHLASRPHRKQPGYDKDDNFRPGFQALKEIGYQNYCSYECGNDGKTYEQKINNLIDSVNFLRQQWDEA